MRDVFRRRHWWQLISYNDSFGLRKDATRSLCSRFDNKFRKIEFLPMQRGTWLGFVIDTKNKMLFIPSEKNRGSTQENTICRKIQEFDR